MGWKREEEKERKGGARAELDGEEGTNEGGRGSQLFGWDSQRELLRRVVERSYKH